MVQKCGKYSIFGLWTDSWLPDCPSLRIPQACSVKRRFKLPPLWICWANCGSLCFPFYPSLSLAMIDRAEISWRWSLISSPAVERFEIFVRLRVCACPPHGQCMCSRMWRCYAESVRCRTSSIWPRVEISLLRRGGLQRRWTSLHLAGGFKGHLASRLATTHPYHIAKEKGLPQAHTTSPLVLGKRHLSWFCAWGVGWGQDDPTKVPRIMLWMIIWPELQTRVFKVDWGDILNLELTYFKYIHRAIGRY